MDTKAIKPLLLDHCKNYVEERLRRIRNTISDIQESLATETKSTAGDKHETGRAMLQLEREKAGKQLAEVQKLQETINKIDITSSSDHIRLGNLVKTSNGIYFISISIGIVKTEDVSYFVVAANSPIGLVLLGKKKGDEIHFNQKQFKILEVN